jgi:hypothetical protein
MRTSGIVIGKFLEELSMFDYKFATNGGLFCVTFKLPYPNITIGKETAIIINKLGREKYGLPFCEFRAFRALNQAKAIKANVSMHDKMQAEYGKEKATTTIFKDGKHANKRYIAMPSAKPDGRKAKQPKNFKIVDALEKAIAEGVI